MIARRLVFTREEAERVAEVEWRHFIREMADGDPSVLDRTPVPEEYVIDIGRVLSSARPMLVDKIDRENGHLSGFYLRRSEVWIMLILSLAVSIVTFLAPIEGARWLGVLWLLPALGYVLIGLRQRADLYHL